MLSYLPLSHLLQMHSLQNAHFVMSSKNSEAIASKARQHESWNPPRLTSQEMIESAMMMADRFNRLFLRTLRQMRDLRRYSLTVTINNPGQVNITEGGQQINAVKVEAA